MHMYFKRTDEEFAELLDLIKKCIKLSGSISDLSKNANINRMTIYNAISQRHEVSFKIELKLKKFLLKHAARKTKKVS